MDQNDTEPRLSRSFHSECADYRFVLHSMSLYPCRLSTGYNSYRNGLEVCSDKPEAFSLVIVKLAVTIWKAFRRLRTHTL